MDSKLHQNPHHLLPPSSGNAGERQAPDPGQLSPPRGRQLRDQWKLQLPESLSGREEGGERTKRRWKLAAVRPCSRRSCSSASPRPEASAAWALTQGGSRGAGREGSRGGGVWNSSDCGSAVLTGRGRNGRPRAGGEWWRPGPWLRRARPRRVWFVFSASGLSPAAASGECGASGPGARMRGVLNNGGPAAPSPWPP